MVRAWRSCASASSSARTGRNRAGAGSPRRIHERAPLAKTHSRPCTQARVAPKRRERAPAALAPTMPPIVQKAPLDGSTGKRSPTSRAAASTAPRSAPGRHHARDAPSRLHGLDRVEAGEVEHHSGPHRAGRHAAPRAPRHHEPAALACATQERDDVCRIDRHGDRRRHAPGDSRALGVQLAGGAGRLATRPGSRTGAASARRCRRSADGR